MSMADKGLRDPIELYNVNALIFSNLSLIENLKCLAVSKKWNAVLIVLMRLLISKKEYRSEWNISFGRSLEECILTTKISVSKSISINSFGKNTVEGQNYLDSIPISTQDPIELRYLQSFDVRILDEMDFDFHKKITFTKEGHFTITLLLTGKNNSFKIEGEPRILSLGLYVSPPLLEPLGSICWLHVFGEGRKQKTYILMLELNRAKEYDGKTITMTPLLGEIYTCISLPEDEYYVLTYCENVPLLYHFHKFDLKSLHILNAVGSSLTKVRVENPFQETLVLSSELMLEDFTRLNLLHLFDEPYIWHKIASKENYILYDLNLKLVAEMVGYRYKLYQSSNVLLIEGPTISIIDQEKVRYITKRDWDLKHLTGQIINIGFCNPLDIEFRHAKNYYVDSIMMVDPFYIIVPMRNTRIKGAFIFILRDDILRPIHMPDIKIEWENSTVKISKDGKLIISDNYLVNVISFAIDSK